MNSAVFEDALILLGLFQNMKAEIDGGPKRMCLDRILLRADINWMQLGSFRNRIVPKRTSAPSISSIRIPVESQKNKSIVYSRRVPTEQKDRLFQVLLFQ